VAVNDRPGSEVDQQTVARLTGAARRHAHRREPSEAQVAAAVAELREMAGGRGDLLAEVAGLLIGFYRRTVEDPRARAAAGYCVAAGADQDLIPRWIEVGWNRAAAARQDRSTGSEPGASYAGPTADEGPRPASTAGRRRLAPHWRSRAGRRPWRTFRYNV
jgi:hypothetical protein